MRNCNSCIVYKLLAVICCVCSDFRSIFNAIEQIKLKEERKGVIGMTIDSKRIKAERIAKGLTQEEMAKKMGWSRSKIAKFENGIMKIGADDLGKYAAALELNDINIFFNFNVPKTEQTA